MPESKIFSLINEIIEEIEIAEKQHRELYASAIDIEDEALSYKTQAESFSALRKVKGLKAAVVAFRAEVEKSGIVTDGLLTIPVAEAVTPVAEAASAVQPESAAPSAETTPVTEPQLAAPVAEAITVPPISTHEEGKPFDLFDSVAFSGEEFGIDEESDDSEEDEEDAGYIDGEFDEEDIGGVLGEISKTIEEINGIEESEGEDEETETDDNDVDIITIEEDDGEIEEEDLFDSPQAEEEPVYNIPEPTLVIEPKPIPAEHAQPDFTVLDREYENYDSSVIDNGFDIPEPTLVIEDESDESEILNSLEFSYDHQLFGDTIEVDGKEGVPPIFEENLFNNEEEIRFTNEIQSVTPLDYPDTPVAPPPPVKTGPEPAVVAPEPVAIKPEPVAVMPAPSAAGPEPVAFEPVEIETDIETDFDIDLFDAIGGMDDIDDEMDDIDEISGINKPALPPIAPPAGIYSDKKPVAFTLFGRRAGAGEWQDLQVKVCEALILKAPYVFAQLDKYQDINPLGETSFSFNENEIKGMGRKLSNGLWTEVSRTPDDTVMICKKLLELCGFSRSELLIETE